MLLLRGGGAACRLLLAAGYWLLATEGRWTKRSPRRTSLLTVIQPAVFARAHVPASARATVATSKSESGIEIRSRVVSKFSAASGGGLRRRLRRAATGVTFIPGTPG